MSYVCPHCNWFPMEDYVLWVSGKNVQNNWWCAIYGEKYDWKQPNRLSVVQTGVSIDQAKACSTSGLFANLINALKLLANQQEDGDGLIQNILTSLCDESRKGLTEGLREFIQIDNHRAFEVRHLREGLGSLRYEGRKDKKGTQMCLSGKTPMNQRLEQRKWARGSQTLMSTTLQRRSGALLW